MKYIILANSSSENFDIPRQLLEINGKPLIERTIGLLKENGIEDILISASDERFKKYGEVYTPGDKYKYGKGKGYWLNAFPYELLKEPVCFIWGDVYFSEEAIKRIVNTEAKKDLFFCSYKNNDKRYIKKWDEPFAYKVKDPENFKKHIEICKKAKDDGTAVREPIIWEVYRSIHGLDINKHIMTDDYVPINDYTCDIDAIDDLEKIKEALK
jgi:NDP-sugar pyrophosphorylase family protein